MVLEIICVVFKLQSVFFFLGLEGCLVLIIQVYVVLLLAGIGHPSEVALLLERGGRVLVHALDRQDLNLVHACIIQLLLAVESLHGRVM